LLSVTMLSIAASTIYINAVSLTNMAMIKDAVIALFLNAIDEEIYMMVSKLCPLWIEQIEADITNSFLANKTVEISEVIEKPLPSPECSDSLHDLSHTDKTGGNSATSNNMLDEEPNSMLKKYIQNKISTLQTEIFRINDVCREKDSKILALHSELLALREEVDGLKRQTNVVCCKVDSKLPRITVSQASKEVDDLTMDEIRNAKVSRLFKEVDGPAIDQMKADVINSSVACEEKETSSSAETSMPSYQHPNPSYASLHTNRNQGENEILKSTSEEDPNSIVEKNIQGRISEVCRDQDYETSTLPVTLIPNLMSPEVLNSNTERCMQHRISESCCDKNSEASMLPTEISEARGELGGSEESMNDNFQEKDYKILAFPDIC